MWIISTTPRATIIGLLQYDPEIFSNLSLPDGINKEILINNIILEYGESPLVYDNPDFMKIAIGAWSMSEKKNIEKILESINSEYEILSDTNIVKNKIKTYVSNETLEGHNDANGNGSNENKVSAYNSNTYQPDNKTDNSYTSHNNSTNTRNRNCNDSENEKIEGNSGKNFFDLQKGVVNFYKENNIYEIITKMFREKFLLYLY